MPTYTAYHQAQPQARHGGSTEHCQAVKRQLGALEDAAATLDVQEPLVAGFIYMTVAQAVVHALVACQALRTEQQARPGSF